MKDMMSEDNDRVIIESGMEQGTAGDILIGAVDELFKTMLTIDQKIIGYSFQIHYEGGTLSIEGTHMGDIEEDA